MDKKVARSQPHLTQSTHAAKFSPVNLTSGAPSSNFAGNQQNDSARYKNKGRSTNGDGFGKNRFPPTGRGGNGFQRRYPANQQSNEVSRTEEQRATNSGVEKSRHGGNASHLLNFTYAPLPSQESGGSRTAQSGGWRSGRGKRQPVHTKEQFLQAHCQFVVKEPVLNDYEVQLADADRMVEWEHITQVRLTEEQLVSCPICMDVPVAAKITKCAHVYCWPCILHYLSLSERSWAKCPICFDSIEEKDLKSVMVKTSPKYQVGDEVTLYLMKRARGDLYVRPKSTWRREAVGQLFTVGGERDDEYYSKLLCATVQDIERIVNEERRQLSALLAQEDTQSLEASFVQAALNQTAEQLDKLNSDKPKSESIQIGKAEQVSTPMLESRDLDAATIKAHSNLKAVSYSDAFDDAASESAETAEVKQPSPVTSSPVVEVTELTSTTNNNRTRSANSTSSCDSGEMEQVAADLVLPPTGTQPGHSSGSKRTEVYYFYQASDGQHLYLHSVNTRILAAEYGSLEMAPPTLTATIVECEDNSMTPELRRRLKYLSHLPLYSQFSVCEVRLKPPVVSSTVLSHFTEELSRRKRMRTRRQRTETKQYHKAQADERRKMGLYPDMALPLDSERHFPASAPNVMMSASVDEFLPQPNADPTVSEQYAVPSRQHEVPLTTPYSFSQAMKGNTGPAAVWPRVQTSYVRASSQSVAHGTAATGGNASDEESSAPTFKQSFSADFDQMLANLTVNDVEADGQAPKGKKNKRKPKKQTLLFSTSGQRANQ